MLDASSELSDSSPLKCLLKILDRGGKITRATDEISIMLNGLRYYSLEVTLDQNYYNIQGYEQEAVDLFNATMSILLFRINMSKIIENKLDSS